MIKKRERNDLVCVEYSELYQTDKLEYCFFDEPDITIYVVDCDKMIGIITLGDFKRHYPKSELAINKNAMFLKYSDSWKTDASSIFQSNKKIKNIPIVDENMKLLFEVYLSATNEEDKCGELEQLCIDNAWLLHYVEKLGYKKILLLEYMGYGERIREAINKDGITIDILGANRFSHNIAKSYDLIIECDLYRYNRRSELLRRITRKYINKYLSPVDMNFFRETWTYYQELKNCGVKVYVFEAPSESKLIHMTNEQKERVNGVHFWRYYYSKADLYQEELEAMFGTKEYQPFLENIFNLPVAVKKNGVMYYEDFYSQYCNTTGGYRITLNKQWEKYTHEIDVYGACAVFGMFVEDNDTIASRMQEQLNNHSVLQRYSVNNYGVRGSGIKEMIQSIQNKQHQSEDIIVFLMMEEEVDFFRKLDKDIPIIELSKDFNENYQQIGYFFFDKPIHCNYKASRFIAQKICKKIESEYECGNIVFAQTRNIVLPKKNRAVNEFLDNPELIEYLAEIKKEVGYPFSGKIGSIVMNCNPFTKGHRFLIEKAREKVDELFIFVVEENKSFFDFEERIQLVRLGVDDLANVHVVPSGKFMISSVTFPEYFQKEDKQHVEIDMSMDIEVFAQCIAPALNITCRFMGEEPIDLVTRQYNETMKRVLPQYGIEVFEIPRKCMENCEHVISASKVRQYMKEGEWELLKKLVPETTYQHLITKYCNC